MLFAIGGNYTDSFARSTADTIEVYDTKLDSWESTGLQLPSTKSLSVCEVCEPNNISQNVERSQQPPTQSLDQELSPPSRSERQAAPENIVQKTDLVPVGHDIYMNENEPLRSGYPVYKGEQRLDVKTIALAVKIYHVVHDQGDSGWHKQYCLEVNSMTKLHHSNVVWFVHCGKCKDKPRDYYIAMILCHKRTLDDIDLDALGQERRINIFLQICHGLKHLHEKGVAHRDLKPTNILFSLDGKNAVVSDFGLSKEVDIKHKKTQTSIKRSLTKYGGTMGWSPAEMLGDVLQREHQPKFRKADIFSLALVGSFIFCNKHHPFSDASHPTDSAVTHTNIIRKCLPDLRRLETLKDGFVPADLFKRMLAHEPKDRPSIVEVLQHCFFWDCSKKMEFFRDMHERYFKPKKLRDDGSEQQKLAYEPVQLPVNSISSTSPSGDHAISGDRGFVDQPVAFSPSSSLDSSESSICFEQSEEDNMRAKIFEEMREVIGDYWLEKVDKNSDFKKTDKKTSDVKAYQNSLVDLIRYIRNYHIYRVGQDEEKKAEVAWKLFSGEFPKLLPHLYKIMESALSSGHERKYKTEIANSKDMDLNDVLAAQATPSQ